MGSEKYIILHDKSEFNMICEKYAFRYHEGYFKYKDKPDEWGNEDEEEFLELRELWRRNGNQLNLEGYSYTTSLGDVISIKDRMILINGI